MHGPGTHLDQGRISSPSSSRLPLARHDGTPVHGVSEKVVGVLGGGQLSQMLCQAAFTMGIKVIALDPMANCRASSITH
ncbi:hypothetical protein AKJ16_DCAP22411 [Drosera capensis]